MRDVMIKNINKIASFDSKMEVINNFINEKNYKEAYRAVAALIEYVSIILLEKIYNKKIESSNIISLITILKMKESKIEKILTEINGEYNLVNYEEISKIDVEFLIGYLDEIVKIILEEHGNIF